MKNLELNKLRVMGYLRRRPGEFFQAIEIAQSISLEKNEVIIAATSLVAAKMISKEGTWYGLQRT